MDTEIVPRGIEIKLKINENIIKETLSRIGIRSKHERKLWPSCYIYTKYDGKSYIAHFKELLRNPDMDELDYKRKNTIIFLLCKWGMIDIPDKSILKDIFSNTQKKKLCVLSKQQVIDEQWEIIPKVHDNVLRYHINLGKYKKENL